MQRGRRALLHVGHRKAFEDVQRLQQHDAAGRRQRHRDDVVAAIAAAHRRADHRLIGFEIVQRHDAAGVANRRRPVFPRPGPRKIRAVPARRSPTASRPDRSAPACRLRAATCRRRGKRSLPRPASAPAAAAMPGSVSAHVVGDDKAVARQLDRRLEQIRQREFAGAVFLQRQRQPGDGAGHADAERGVARFRDIGLAVGAEEHVARRRGRRGLAIVDGDVLAALRRVDDHEAAAADVSGARIGHGQRKAGRDRGIDRIAAPPQDVGADLRADVSPAPPPCRVRQQRRERCRAPAACKPRRSCAPAGRADGRNQPAIAASSARRSAVNEVIKNPAASCAAHGNTQQLRVAAMMLYGFRCDRQNASS